MDATQMISDSILESDEEENEEENENKRGRPLAKLCILKNEHIPETELPLFLGDNVLGRDPNTCTLPLPAPSISKQHATICISVYRRRGCPREVDTEALVWDLGSMNGTRKGHLKLSPNVRYALSERDSLLVADIPCQFVSCAIDTVSSQGHMRTPVSRNSGVNARLPDASGENTSTGSKECVNGGTKARVSLPNQDKRKTPVRTSCLSFEQTPTQPPGSLVPESDLDSDGERGDRKCKALVSDSDSHKSSPTCSTFLSPSNKIVPESEDESPITPSSSSSTKNRPYRCATFSKEETDVDVGRQQLKKEKALAIVDDSEEEEERAAAGGRKSERSGQRVPVKPESNVSLKGEDELPVSTPAIFTGAIPAFDMDSDTDMEGEEEGLVTLNTNQKADQPPNTAQFHMDSDTDVDEDEYALDKVAKSVPSSADHTKPPHVIQPESITMDSDTDVDDDDDDDDDAAVSDTAPKAKHTADSAPSTQLKDLNLDSDTDVDEEEEEKDRGTNNARSKIDETPTRSDIKPVAVAAPHSLHLDSDTDDEAIPAPAIGEPSVASAVSDAETGLGVLSDSDTDVDDDYALVIPVAVSTLSAGPSTRSGALQSGSDADTDVDESSVPTAGDGVIPPDLRVDGDTDVEDKKEDFGEAGEGQIPSLQRENTPGLLVPLQQNCSTPVQVSEGGLEDVATQAFLSPSSGPFRGAIAPAARPLELSSCSDSQEDDFVLDETQSFILQARDCNPPEDHTMEPTQSFSLESSSDGKGEQSSRGGSFQLGLTDSSRLQAQAQALAMESTQAFVSVVGGVNLEDTQAYAAVSNADRTSLENDSNLEEPGRCSVMSAKEGQVDLALEATQAYISEPCSDSEDETDEDERKHAATAETQPFLFDTSSTLAVAETQPMSAFEEEEEESLDKENPTSSVLQHGEAAQPQKRHLSAALSVAETQPMHISEDEESDDEDLIPGPRKRKEKPLQLEEEQTQTLTNSDLSLVETQPVHTGVGETQPMATSGNEESDEEDSIPGPRKRKAKQLRLEDEQTQTLTNSDLSLVETQPVHIGAGESQPMDAGDDGESDEEDSIPGPRKRKAKQLRLEDEQTQTLTNSDLSLVETQPVHIGAGESQPMDAGDDGESDEEDSIPGPRKRRAKPLQLEEESQPLTSSEVSAVETQPMGACEGEQSDEEDSTPGPRKRKAKPQRIQEEETQPLTHSEASTVETKTGKGKQSEAGTSGTTTRGRRGTRARLREEEEQAECSEPPKRQTRGKNKVLPTTRGGRGKPRPDEEESEEEEEVEQAKRARGKKSMMQQKDNEEKRLATERNKHAENNNLIKEQEDKLERERKEKEEQERVQAENAERLRLEQERAEKERIERKEQEEKERADKAQKVKEEQLERERKEKEEKERLDCEKAEREEKERIENERKEKEEKERLETSKRELEERLERERKEQDHQARLEREAKEKEEREEKERKKKEEKERLQREKAEREEKERIDNERKEKEEKERLETSKRELEERLERERKEQEHQARLEREAKEKEERERVEKDKQDKEAKEKQIKEQEENKKTPARSRRASRRTIAEPCTTEPERAISAEDDVPARRTRSRSNSSNSVSSERSASSVSTPGSRGRGRGRGVKRTSGPPPAAVARSSNRRRTVAAGPTQQDSNEVSPQGVLSRSNSTNSLNSEISICSVSSQSRGRGGRLRGRGRKTDSIPPIDSQRDQSLTPKPTARGRKSRKAEESSTEVKHEDDEKEKADSQQASTTRGRRRANANGSDPTADKEDPSSQKCATEESLLHKRGRGQKAVKSETVESPVAPATSDGDEAKEKRKGRKRELEANREEVSSSSSKIPKGKEKTQTTEAAEEGKGETKDEIGVQAKRRGRASSAQAKKNVKEPPTEVEVKEESEKMEEWAVDRRGRGRTSVVLKKKKEQQEDSGASVDQDPHVEASEPQTPTNSASRKRQAPLDSSPVAKTPRSSSASPASSGRLRAASQAYKVLFTGVVDEDGERVLARLGGSMAKGVADMNYLVTDKVRRTVKFLCAVAKGVPIVTTHWLEKSGKSGSFLSPNAFLVKDPEQEEKFSFCLQESLRLASSQPLLQGYEIHVTKSVKPEPVYMKDIISCSGATFLPKMPSTHKPQTVVISCEEDWPLCGPALSASLPVVTAEFILTGILQQKRDLQTHTLSAPANTLQPAGGRGRSRKKT
ncbi:mediator of DNA damage checkpoint protein 1 isoform X2 [Sebastes umbrosus]|uniref:mediator of DNA damage checkpoint protein 1 isoform X2 n=1 Tax=Sebastes umbrosus TaxID=72105 RepID=UPI00189DA435|nr:mediator of DNA damage checkpoint protein 1 isoform X2 [Sebastes umbrosus]